MHFQEFSPKTGEIWQNILGESPFQEPQPGRGGFMIDEINYFPERENYQKKKKVDEDWKELKKKKILQDSKKTNRPEKSKPPENKK